MDLATLRAALWSVRALRQVRRRLRRGLEGRAGRPPRLPRRAERGVHAVLRRWPSTCLERALVLQRWEAAHGEPKAVVIGVQGPVQGFRAHAWLEGSHDPLAADYHELTRIEPGPR